MRRVAAVLLIALLTATGIFEYVIIRNKNVLRYSYDDTDPITVWIDENTDSGDVILTPPYVLHPVVMGGGMLFYGHSYYAQSAGYDVYTREEAVYRMYRAGSPEQLKGLVKENGIDYIVVDNQAREELSAREDVIAATYEAVFQSGDFVIYATGEDDKSKK